MCSIGTNNLSSIEEISQSQSSDISKIEGIDENTAKELKEKFSSKKIDPKNISKDEIFKIFSNYISEILTPLEKNLENLQENVSENLLFSLYSISP